MRAHPNRLTRLLASAAVAAIIAGGTAGCKTTSSTDTTGSIAVPVGPRSEADLRRDVDLYGERYRANNRDLEAAIRYAAALRGIGQRNQAAAVLEQTALLFPKDRRVLGAYGRALADAGKYAHALEVLERAHTPDQPDWRILSVEGAVLDQMGRPQEARQRYETALRIVPEEPSVLSNLGLSYALAKELPQAESTLRRAAARAGTDRRVRQNLALVIGLQGRFEEAQQIARADLPVDEASANVAYLRQILAEPETLKKLARPADDGAKPQRAAAPAIARATGSGPARSTTRAAVAAAEPAVAPTTRAAAAPTMRAAAPAAPASASEAEGLRIPPAGTPLPPPGAASRAERAAATTAAPAARNAPVGMPLNLSELAAR